MSSTISRGLPVLQQFVCGLEGRVTHPQEDTEVAGVLISRRRKALLNKEQMAPVTSYLFL